MSDPSCELCAGAGGEVIAGTDELRVVLIDDPQYPGYCRVIWNEHVREMTDLPPAALARFMGAVFAVEDALRRVLQPDKINVASLGNMTPHLHWHVVPRFADDAHFPRPIWAERQRDTPESVLQARGALLPRLAAEIATHLPGALSR